MQSLIDTLKLSAAAKAWMGIFGIALQIAMSYIPAHDNVWYNVAQGLLAFLSVLGIYAVPNKPAVDPAPVEGPVVGPVTPVG